MGEREQIRMGEILEALDRIESWVGDIRDVLSSMDPETVVGEAEVFTSEPPGSLKKQGICPPPKKT
jgi:hypothetical protein